MDRAGSTVKILALVILTFSTALSCQNYDPGRDGKVAIDEFPGKSGDALCAYIEKCDMEWVVLADSDLNCQELIQHLIDGFQELVDAVGGGRMQYDEVAAYRCLNKLYTDDCRLENLPYGDNFCKGVFSGVVENGGTCYQDVECLKDSYCDESASNCPGTCQPFKRIGDSCDSQEECNWEVADCDYNTELCVELGREGDRCDSWLDCLKGLTCNQTFRPSVCTQPGTAGADCSFETDCVYFLGCVNQTCAEWGEQGESCRIGLTEPGIWLFEACVPGLYCDADHFNGEEIGTCQPKKPAGTECRSFYECISGLLCMDLREDPQTSQPIPGTCGTPLKLGDACTPATPEPECEPRLYCDSTSETCRPVPDLGEPCTEETGCLGRHVYCDGSPERVCRPKKTGGESCSSNDECLNSDCRDGVCQPINCTP